MALKTLAQEQEEFRKFRNNKQIESTDASNQVINNSNRKVLDIQNQAQKQYTKTHASEIEEQRKQKKRQDYRKRHGVLNSSGMPMTDKEVDNAILFENLQPKQYSISSDKRTSYEKQQSQQRAKMIEEKYPEMLIKAQAVTGNTNEAKKLAGRVENWGQINDSFKTTSGLFTAGVAAGAAAPVATGLGIIGDQLFDMGVGHFTDGQYNTWYDYATKELGWNPFLAALSNPGGWIGGGYKQIGKGISHLYDDFTSRITPYGFRIGDYAYNIRPMRGVFGMGVPIEGTRTKVKNFTANNIFNNPDIQDDYGDISDVFLQMSKDEINKLNEDLAKYIKIEPSLTRSNHFNISLTDSGRRLPKDQLRDKVKYAVIKIPVSARININKNDYAIKNALPKSFINNSRLYSTNDNYLIRPILDKNFNAIPLMHKHANIHQGELRKWYQQIAKEIEADESILKNNRVVKYYKSDWDYPVFLTDDAVEFENLYRGHRKNLDRVSYDYPSGYNRMVKIVVGRESKDGPLRILTAHVDDSEYVRSIGGDARKVLLVEPGEAYIVPKQTLYGSGQENIDILGDMFTNYDAYRNGSKSIGQNKDLWRMIYDIKNNNKLDPNKQFDDLIKQIDPDDYDIDIIAPEPLNRTIAKEDGIRFYNEGDIWHEDLIFKKGGRFNKRPKLIKKCKRYEN